mmetsp:Transcript_6964/g.10860  ORF Transcript_6964/g.10860 Transcript_6964/m.10860 type:complete len:83 (-) Transcript_6964:76-324(-)
MFAQTAVSGARPVAAPRSNAAGKGARQPVAAMASSVGLRRASTVDSIGRSQKTFQSVTAKQTAVVRSGRGSRSVTTAMFEVR